MVVRRPIVRSVSALTCLALAACVAAAAEGKKKPAAGAPLEFAVVGGTVFRDSGFALAEAEVTLAVEGAEPAKGKIKKLKTVSSPRGEFSFRVPPVAARYRVGVFHKGFQAAEKVVEIQGGSERVDATFNLSPESKH